MDKKFSKCLESWTQLEYFFQYVQIVKKMFGIMKKMTEVFTKILSNKQFITIFVINGGLGPPITSLSQVTSSPTPLTGAPIHWMKDNHSKLKSTSYRILLVNVSESGLISEFSTIFFCSDFDTNFTGVFFHDSNHSNFSWKSWKNLYFFHKRILMFLTKNLNFISILFLF